ncbi:MAG: CHAT domain-containing tetratricopeptide repeat protein [Bacteroidota bacterium]
MVLSVRVTGTDLDLAFSYEEKAKLHLENGHFDSATYYCNNALKIYKQEDGLGPWLGLKRTLGHGYRDTGQLEEALIIYESIFLDIWRKPVSKQEFVNLAWAHAALGYAQKKLSFPKIEIKDQYEHALDIFVDSLKAEDYYVAKYIYGELGNAYNRLRDYEEAEYCHKRRIFFLKTYEDWPELAKALNDLGMVYQNTAQNQKAIKIFSEALSLNELWPEIEILLLTNLAYSYYLDGQFENAWEFNESCYQFVQEHTLAEEEKETYLIRLYENYGHLYTVEGQYEEADSCFNKAIAAVKQEVSPDLNALAQMYMFKGDLNNEFQRPSKAIAFFQKALDILVPEYTSSEQELPLPKQLIAEPNLIECLGGLANSYAQLYRSGQPGFEEKAINAFDLAIVVEQILIGFYSINGVKLTALDEHRWVKESALDFLYSLFEDDYPNESLITERIFRLIEDSKSILLLQEIGVSEILTNNQLDSLRKVYYQINQNLTKLEGERLELERNGNEIPGSLLADIKSLNRLQDELIDHLQVSIEQYSGGIMNERSLSQTKRKLKVNEAVVDYFLGDEQLYFLVFSGKSVHLGKSQVNEVFRSAISRLRDEISDPARRGSQGALHNFKETSYDLYKMVFADVMNGIPEEVTDILIIPDGLLGVIPFEVLVSSSADGVNSYLDLPYLARRYIISYSPSIALHWGTDNHSKKGKRSILAGFAPDYNKEKDTLRSRDIEFIERANVNYNLPGAQAEVDTICTIMNGQPFFGPDANEQVFKNVAGGYQILLLSMHSIVHIDTPGLSKLLFTHGSSGRQDDDLHSYELNALDLNADLVVLSACNTGFGKVRKGEGVMSLSRSFFSAGAQSTVFSLWKVPDKQTKEVMVRFFSHLKSGKAKNEALWQAKIDYLDNIQSTHFAAHPYFWSGFVLSGDSGSPIGHSERLFYWWFLLILPVILLFYLLKRFFSR